MKAQKICLILSIILFIFIICSILYVDNKNKAPDDSGNYVSVEHEDPIYNEPIQEELTQDNEEVNFHTSMSCDWGSEDSYLLCKIAMAEAQGEGVQGKAYVMMVVLNRVIDDRFPDTIHDVIYEPKQFTPVHTDKWNNIEPDKECWEALNMIMVDKWDKSQGALYFESCSSADNWHSRNLEHLFTYGGHRFYK